MKIKEIIAGLVGFGLGVGGTIGWVARKLVKHGATLQAFKWEAVDWFEHLLFGRNEMCTRVTRFRNYKAYSPNSNYAQTYYQEYKDKIRRRNENVEKFNVGKGGCVNRVFGGSAEDYESRQENDYSRRRV